MRLVSAGKLSRLSPTQWLDAGRRCGHFDSGPHTIVLGHQNARSCSNSRHDPGFISLEVVCPRCGHCARICHHNPDGIRDRNPTFLIDASWPVGRRLRWNPRCHYQQRHRSEQRYRYKSFHSEILLQNRLAPCATSIVLRRRDTRQAVEATNGRCQVSSYSEPLRRPWNCCRCRRRKTPRSLPLKTPRANAREFPRVRSAGPMHSESLPRVSSSTAAGLRCQRRRHRQSKA